MRNFVLFFLVLLFTLPATAQQSVAEAAAQARSSAKLGADAPTRDQVMTLLELLQVRRTMTVMMESMKQVMREGAEQSFREKVPNPTPKQLAALRGMFDDIVDTMSMDDMIDAIIPIYQRHLTKTDIDELIRFYSSPVGQKLLHEQPQIIQESMQAGAAVEQKRMDEIKAKIAQRAQEMMEADQEPTSTPKKQ
ncbi:MAG TPA: DUF2059 domain-containing protein [Candidatus Angelobacter sp.]|nr:DUF2059 domain-containing protein [Candidatus Angelobacter sp.]